MAAQILTQEDLTQFKAELFRELKHLFNTANTSQPRKWIKSYEVKEMLGLSSGTLQNLRANGTLGYTKLGGLVFYDYDDIIRLMEKEKKPARTTKYSRR